MTWLVLALLLVAGGSIVLWEHHRFRAWAPNVATSALSIAVTVSIVNLMLRRDRSQPRLDSVLRAIDGSFTQLITAIVVDYARTHHDSFQQIPKNALDMIWLWGDSQDDIDIPRELVPGAQVPIVAKVCRFYEELDHLRMRNVDILDPELVRAIDDFPMNLRQIRATPSELEEWKLPEVATGLVHFAYVLKRHDRPSSQIDPWIREKYACQERHFAQARAFRDTRSSEEP